MRNFMKIKSSRNGGIILMFTDIGEKCSIREFQTSQICFSAIRENKMLTEISEFTVYQPMVRSCTLLHRALLTSFLRKMKQPLTLKALDM